MRVALIHFFTLCVTSLLFDISVHPSSVCRAHDRPTGGRARDRRFHRDKYDDDDARTIDDGDSDDGETCRWETRGKDYDDEECEWWCRSTTHGGDGERDVVEWG